MRRERYYQVLLAVVAGLLVVNLLASILRDSPPAFGAKTVEYKVVWVDVIDRPRDIPPMLEKLGKEGWEVAGILSQNGFSDAVIFKR